MMRMLALTGLLGVCVLGLSGCAAPQGKFGEAMKHPEQKPLAVADVLAHPEKYNGQFIRVRGTVKNLCDHSGCWMEVGAKNAAAGDGLVVVFSYDKSLGRVPPEARGHEAVVEGKLSVKEIDEGERRRQAVEHGASVAELAKIYGSKKVIRLECPAAEIAGVKPLDAKPCEHEEQEQTKEKK